ncbi:DNA-processing protein DprA [Jannaschia sp. W003]|uniref:DNA-processing protein DprA n=1 Tax=Jannaschia sp. W003 TaxID=2867012 RepID=UPI0021A6743D|nr:DNA-processing protein DprA [Jannaschia sp. W003]UWQ23080.1 DNA-processing protein DprA [Jannaschia sp. W003]
MDGPPSQAEALARLRLARSARVGPATFRRLLAEHGSGEAALAALPDAARAAGLERYAPASEDAARAEVRAARRAGARLLLWGAPGYPARLASVRDAPPVLWAQGDAALMGGPAVAVVGTRNASSLALRMARALGRDLAEAGVTVISGLARGIDGAAHGAALPRTVAVHAGGLDRPYPPENAALAARIAAEGCAVSERPFGLAPQARDFPRRNRIVSGLAQAVVVVEAAARSGSMITARDALDQGREVLAVPGHPIDGRASGCLLLLRDGAGLVRGADDVLAALEAQREDAAPPPPAPDAPPPSLPDDALRARLLALLSPVPSPEDQLCRDAGAEPSALLAALAELELEGLAARRPGGGVVRL